MAEIDRDVLAEHGRRLRALEELDLGPRVASLEGTRSAWQGVFTVLGSIARVVSEGGSEVIRRWVPVMIVAYAVGLSGAGKCDITIPGVLP